MTPLLDLAGVTVVHPGRGRAALRGIDLRVEGGVHLGLTGPSGAGKTTLVRAVVGLLPLDAGTVGVDGRPVVAGAGVRRLRWLRRRVQVVAQDASGSLDPRHTVRRSVAEPIRCLGLPDDPGRRVAELVELVGLPGSVLGRRPHELSGGQRQRVALARALAARPALLVGDEMFSGLDAVTRVELATVLGELASAEAVTMLLVAHDLGTLRLLCPRLAVLADGRLVEHGPTADLLDRPAHDLTQRLVAARGPLGRRR